MDLARRRPTERRTRRPFPGVAVLLGRHRRLVVALLLATASGVAVDAATARPPAGVLVVAAAADLPAGHLLAAADLTQVAVPRGVVPEGVVSAGALVGEVLAAPMRRGEVVTDVRVLTSVAGGLSAGQVALAVRLDDEGAVRWLRPGQRVDVLAVPADPLSGVVAAGSGRAEVVARGVAVLDVPGPGSGSAFPTVEAASSTVLLALDGDDARTVAASSAAGWLTLTLLP